MSSVTKWEDVSYVLASDYRKKVLSSLETPKTPSKIGKEININIAHISRALSELEKKEMIKCLTPNSTKGKLYIILDYGKEILKELLKVNL